MIDAPAFNPLRGARGVAELLREVGDLLVARFIVCVVRGEISGYARAASGHSYFNLKDSEGGGAVLRCAMFRRATGLLGFVPADGQQVELRGKLGVYEPRGELQLIVESMQHAGAGALYERFVQTKARLEAQGLFDPARKRRVPAYPRAVGVVTSLGAAALHDVLTALARRAPHVRVVVYPSLVQGAEAPDALAAGIATASRRAEVEVLILCRGGGSLEDLWAFNDERVVRAIVASAMPVVCGVGHETDVTLADFAADLRAPTPTAAAELVAPMRQTCIEALDAIAQSMRRRVHDVLDMHTQRLDRSALRLSRPGQGVYLQAQRLTLLAHRLDRLVPWSIQARRAQLARLQDDLRYRAKTHLTAANQHLEGLAVRLRTLDPAQVLARGYAWLSDDEGRAVMSVDRLTVGTPLRAVLSDGMADVQVTEIRRRTSA